MLNFVYLFSVSSTFTLKGIKTIQKDIMTNGPVQASFIVYEDFVTYRSGKKNYITQSYHFYLYSSTFFYFLFLILCANVGAKHNAG